jgi:hypothetical protein
VPQSTATLLVPASAVDAYKEADQWKEFGSIQAIGGSLRCYTYKSDKCEIIGKSIWEDLQKTDLNAIGIVPSTEKVWAENHKNVLIENTSGTTTSYTCPNFVLTDLTQGYNSSAAEATKTGFYTPVSFKVTKGEYKRQAYAGYNTVCLPFDFKASELSSKAKAYTFDYFDEETGKAVFKNVSGVISAGTPCIVKMPANATWTVNLAGKTIDEAAAAEDLHMSGTYLTTDAFQSIGYTPRNADNVFAPLTQYLHPFRACFTIEEHSTKGAAITIALLDENGNAEGITELQAESGAKTAKAIYTLGGQRIREIKRSGLYVVDGKTVYVEAK